MSRPTRMLKISEFKLFKKWCLHYIDKLGLARYSFRIIKKDFHSDSCARCRTSQEGAWSDIEINTNFLSDYEDPAEEIRLMALHECLHVMLSHYRYLADSRYAVASDDIGTEEEKIIKVLEKLL